MRCLAILRTGRMLANFEIILLVFCPVYSISFYRETAVARYTDLYVVIFLFNLHGHSAENAQFGMYQ